MITRPDVKRLADLPQVVDARRALAARLVIGEHGQREARQQQQRGKYRDEFQTGEAPFPVSRSRDATGVVSSANLVRVWW